MPETKPTQIDRVTINGQVFTVALIGGEVYYWDEEFQRWVLIPVMRGRS